MPNKEPQKEERTVQRPGLGDGGGKLWSLRLSARWNDGRVTSLEILSEKGGTCRQFALWPGGVKVETAAGQSVATSDWAPGIPAFETNAGEKYCVRPK